MKCKNCGKKIYLTNELWIHKSLGEGIYCKRNIVEPEELK